MTARRRTQQRTTPRHAGRDGHGRWLRIAAVLLLAGGVASSQQTPSAGQPPTATFKKRTELVMVPAIVKDKHGFVPGLTKDDFKVSDNGKPQEIKFFEQVTTGTERPHSVAPAAPNEFTNRVTVDQAAKPQRLTIIAFDLINMPTLHEAEARKALWDFLSESTRAMEPTAVYTIGKNGVGVVVDFTSDPRLVREALDRLKLGRQEARDASLEAPGIHSGPKYHSEGDENVATSATVNVPAGGPGAMGAILTQLESLQQEIDLNMVSQERRYTVLDTLSGLQQIAQACALVPGRKSLVWVTGGFPFDISPTDMMIRGQEATFRGGRRDWSDVYPEYVRTWRALQDAQVVLYPVDVRGTINPAPLDPSIRNPGWRSTTTAVYSKQQTDTGESAFADATGGRAFYGTNDLKEAFEQAVRDSDQYYMLGYYISSDQHPKSGWHSLSVKLARPHLELRARNGYFYQESATDLQATRDHDLSAAVFSPIDFTAIQLTARWMGTKQAELGKDAAFELDMPPGFLDLDSSENQVQLDIVAQVKTLEGKPVGKTYSRTIAGKLNASQAQMLREHGFSYAGAVTVPPGDYTVRFVVRDGLTGHMGSVTAPLKVSR